MLSRKKVNKAPECLTLEETENLIHKEIASLESVIEKASNQLPDVDGKHKFIRICHAELKFIKSLKSNDPRRAAKIVSTNTTHLTALLNTVFAHSYDIGLKALLKKVHYRDRRGDKHFITVDIVSANQNGEIVWAKVIARNALALHNVWTGDTDSTARPLTEQARQYQLCSLQNVENFSCPKITFHAVAGVTAPLATRLETLGVKLYAELVPVRENTLSGNLDSEISDGDQYEDVTDEEYHSDNSDMDEEILKLRIEVSERCALSDNGVCTSRVNLDVTSLILLVSQLCNEGPPPEDGCKFADPSHEWMCREEAKQSSLQTLMTQIKGKTWLVCQSAWTEFLSIVSVVGGPREQERASQLQVELVPDLMSERSRNLKLSSRVREVNRTIFGVGDELKVYTTTANIGFLRAAEHQGVNFSVLLHDARALTETARRIPLPVEVV